MEAKKIYAIGRFQDLQKLRESDSYIILRHDIDFSLSHAKMMAAREFALGIRATYFVLLHSPYYNPLTEDSRKTIHSLIELGHEIGLHYDPRFGSLEEEVKLLGNYLDTKIKSIARHNPFGVNIDVDKKPADLIDAYDKELMKDVKYISDSSGYWREGCACGHLGRHRKMQILIHPEWWNQTTIAPDKILEEINRLWHLEVDRQGVLAVANLRLHREKMLKGLV